MSGGRTAAPMVRAFFEPIKDDIKDIIAPPQKALIVVDEDDPEGPPDGEIPAAIPVEGPMRALPVEDLDPDKEAGPPVAEEKPEPEPEPEPERRPARALPVDDDEVIDETMEVE